VEIKARSNERNALSTTKSLDEFFFRQLHASIFSKQFWKRQFPAKLATQNHFTQGKVIEPEKSFYLQRMKRYSMSRLD